MKKIWQDAKDKYVTAVVFYGNSSDDKLYEDAEFTVQAKEEDVLEAFLKGNLVVMQGTDYTLATKVAANVVTADGNAFTAAAKA